MKQLWDNDLPDLANYVIALLVETMAEEFPGERGMTVMSLGPPLIVVDLYETLM
jgi:hypothetical protein